MQRRLLSDFTRDWGSAEKYFLAVGIFLLALGLRLLLFPVDAGLVYMTFYPGMVLSFYLCGTGPGTVMVVLSAITGFYAFLPPYLSFSKSWTGDIAILAFLFSAVLINLVVRELQAVSKLAGESEDAFRNSEAALQMTESRYKTILQDQTEFISRRTPDMRLRYVNEAFCRFFGKTQEELIGNAWTPVPHPDDIPHIKEELSKLSPKCPLVEIENRVIAADGSFKWCRFINRGFFDENGVLLEVQSVGRDITASHEIQEQLQISNARFNDLASRVPAGIYTIRVKANGVIGFDYVSDRLLEMVGANREEALRSPEIIFEKVHPLDRRSLDMANQAAALNLHTFRWEGRCLIEGQYRWLHIEANPNVLSNGDSLWNGIGVDVTDRKILEDEIKQLAFHDSLTQLPNRRLLHDRLCVALTASKRSGQLGAILFIDLDNFKPLNDSHGHEAGDALLVEVAARLISCVRAMDTVARIGGDEFVVMVSDLDSNQSQSEKQAIAIAEKIRSKVAEPYVLSVRDSHGVAKTTEHRCYASIGVVLFPEGDMSEDDLLICADSAMYQAKAQGRNRINFYEVH